MTPREARCLCARVGRSPLLLLGLVLSPMLANPSVARCDELDALPPWALYVPSDGRVATLLPGELPPAVGATADSAGLRAFVEERRAYATAVANALSDGLAEGSGQPSVDHSESQRLLREAASGGLASLGEPALLALAIGSRSNAAAGRALGDEALDELVRRGLSTPDRAAAVALMAADEAKARGDWMGASEQLANREESDALGALVLYEQGLIAESRGNGALAARRFAGLLKRLHREQRLIHVAPSLRNDLVVSVARGHAGQTGAWLRVNELVDLLPTPVDDELLVRLVDEAARAADVELLARMNLLAGKLSLRADAVPGYLLAAVQTASKGEPLPGVAVCLEAGDLATRPASGILERAQEEMGSLVATCLGVAAAAPQQGAEDSGLLALFGLLTGIGPERFGPDDHARYGLALLGARQRLAAREELDRVEFEQLDGTLRSPYALGMATLYAWERENLQLDTLACERRVAMAPSPAEKRLRGWVDVALEEARDEDRGALLEIALALALATGDHAAAVEGLSAYISAAKKAGHDADRMVLATRRTLECLSASGRWPDLVSLTPRLRGELPAEVKDAVFGELATRLVEAHLAWANALHLSGRSGDGAQVLMDLSWAWRDHPLQGEVLYATGELLVAAGRSTDAFQHFAVLYEQHPDDERSDDALLAAAHIALAQPDPVLARSLLEALVSRYSGRENAQWAAEILESLPAAP